MYSIFISGNIFLPMLWQNFDSEVHLCTLNTSTWVLCFEHTNLIVIYFLLAEQNHHCKCDHESRQWLVCWASSLMWLACGFGLPLKVDWRWQSLALIPDTLRTKERHKFWWSTLLPQDNRKMYLFHIVRSNNLKRNFLVLLCSLTN
jgi:hypothetical protein